MTKMAALVRTAGICLLVTYICESQQIVYDHGVDLPTDRPLNIAHRGSSGSHPQHTIAAYKQAIRDGADLIECDIHMTRDRHLVCLHDAFLSEDTDVRVHRDFGRRKRTVAMTPGQPIYDWFSFDFTLEELRALRVVQRELYRDPSYNGQFTIPTFEEFLAVAQNADRPVGIYPELKTPSFINSLPLMVGERVEDLLLESLTRHGYNGSSDPCFIQSYDVDSLKYLKDKTDLPLVVLVSRESQIYGATRNDSRLIEWGSMFYGIGAWKTQVAVYHNYQYEYKNWITGTTDLVTEAKAAGLRIHLYTFRNEDQFLAWDFGQNPAEEYRYFMQFGIDGYFTDFPRTLDMVLDATYAEAVTCGAATLGMKAFGSVIAILTTVMMWV